MQDKNIWLQRKLKDYKWQLFSDKTIKLIDEKHTHHLFMDKVRLTSLMRFAISALDKIRIEEGKQSRAKIKKIREKVARKREVMRNKRLIHARAKINRKVKS